MHQVLPSVWDRPVGPFIFLDVLGPFDLPAGRPVRVPDHPHAGLATISHLVEGEGHHGDSLGHEQALFPGSVNWMAAGSGIVHNEGLSTNFTQTGGTLHGFQAWLFLTEAERRAGAQFVHTPAAAVPRWSSEGASVSLLSGRLAGHETRSTTTRDHAALVVRSTEALQTRLLVPPDWELGLYVTRGELTLDGARCGAHQGGVREGGGPLELTLAADTTVFVLAGPPLTERVLFDGSLVGGSAAELHAARGRFDAR